MNLFAYGTLMFPEVWKRVVGDEYQQAPAQLSGMALYRAAGELFPVMVEGQPSDIAPGLVFFEIPAETWAKLDRYESKVYDRVEVAAEIPGGRIVRAQAYQLPLRNRHVASAESWDAEVFRRDSLAQYLQQLTV
jgi:gamma-glutamylcyclotransferase (GGCT)/AIG2-like uncharacterized protein YtfP